MHLLVKCYEGRSRSSRKPLKPPTKEFLLYLKKAAQYLVMDDTEYDLKGCCVKEMCSAGWYVSVEVTSAWIKCTTCRHATTKEP